jgi:hypothetical protein
MYYAPLRIAFESALISKSVTLRDTCPGSWDSTRQNDKGWRYNVTLRDKSGHYFFYVCGQSAKINPPLQAG